MQSPQGANNLVRERDPKIKINHTKFDKSNDKSKVTLLPLLCFRSTVKF